MTDIAVRACRTEDLPTVARLRWDWVRENSAAPVGPLEEFVSRFVAWAADHASSHRCTVLTREGTVIGMAWLAITARVPHPHALERAAGDVQSVYVLPAERGRGLGGGLITAVLRQAGELGLERVTVHSSDRAVPAYTRRGFAPSSRLLRFPAAPDVQDG